MLLEWFSSIFSDANTKYDQGVIYGDCLNYSNFCPWGNMSSRCSSNSEAHASELLEHLESMLPS